jgi:hypothetical protein
MTFTFVSTEGGIDIDDTAPGEHDDSPQALSDEYLQTPWNYAT